MPSRHSTCLFFARWSSAVMTALVCNSFFGRDTHMNPLKNVLHTSQSRSVLARLLVAVRVVLLLGALIALPALAGDVGAASQASAPSPLPRSPLSGSVLVARAIHSGQL